MKYLLATLTVLMSSIAYADHHAPPAEPLVVEIHGCTLNEGVALADVIKVGRAEFPKLFSADKLKMSSYIWEAVAVSPPSHAQIEFKRVKAFLSLTVFHDKLYF